MKKIIILFLLVFCFTGGRAASASAPDLINTDAEYTALKTRLEQMLATEKGTYGVVVLDINSGRVCAVNPLEQFHAASTFKLPMNIYLYRSIASGGVNPGQSLVYERKHYEGGTGKLQYKPVGSSFDIETLAKYSIVYSDNVATNMLLSHLGKQNVKDFMHSTGGLVVNSNNNVTCPRDMAIYMKELMDLAAASPEPYNRLIGYLESTIYNERIPALLPRGIKIAHKIGNWPAAGAYHDVGHVSHPVNPYIIAVFSKNTAGPDLAYGIIRLISKTVYDYQNRFVAVRLLLIGNPLQTSATPFLEQGRVFVPVRAVAEALGAEVGWDEITGRVSISRADSKIEFQAGSPGVLVNGSEVQVIPAARVVNGRTMVPVRFVSETMGAEVSWDDTSHTVSITSQAGSGTQAIPPEGAIVPPGQQSAPGIPAGVERWPAQEEPLPAVNI